MRFFLSTLLLCLSLMASPSDIRSFNANFEQRIVDDHGKIILYQGQLWAASPQNALWKYTKPIQKSVIINGQKLTILEPLLEQATITALNNEINFFALLQKAKKIDDIHYRTVIEGTTYTITFQKDVPSQISYTDGFDNRITITFSHQTLNKSIDPKLFTPVIPADYDVLRD